MLTVTEAEEHDVPPGFEAFHSSPFFAMIGPAWIRQADSPPSFGIRIEQRHTNTGGTAHGGLLAALADMTLGQGVRASVDHDLHLVTAGLTIDFALPSGPATGCRPRPTSSTAHAAPCSPAATSSATGTAPSAPAASTPSQTSSDRLVRRPCRPGPGWPSARSARRLPTISDCRNALTSTKKTRLDRPRQYWRAWHAEGQDSVLAQEAVPK